MPLLQEGAVLVENCIVAWDGVTKPEENAGGTITHKLKVVVPPGSPDADLVNQIANAELSNGKFRGTMPNGGHWAIKPIAPGEYGDMFVGGHIINPSTLMTPDVFDDKQQQLAPMQYANLLYQGQRVSLIVNCFTYDNKSKGIGTGLEGIRIELAANAQPIAMSSGGGSRTAANYFGGGQAQGGQPQPNNMGQQPMGQQPMQQGQAMGGMQQNTTFLPGQ